MDLSDYVDYATARLTELMTAHEHEKANDFLMHSGALFLADNEEIARKTLFENLFSVIGKNYRTQYQCYDFECVDYDLYVFSNDMPMVRGPRPAVADLIAGNYVTVMGAAQLFGRFHATPLHRMISVRFKLPVLNLSVGGAGPEFYLSREHIIAAANRSRFVILQVLSGRSIGCAEYPGERLTAPANQPDAPKRDRLEILQEIWHSKRSEAQRLVKKWSENYLRAYLELVQRVNRPVVLVWMSERSPDDWTPDALEKAPNWGAFPQLVSRAMVSSIATKCALYIEGRKDAGLPHAVTSRVTGKPCPYFNPDGTIEWKNAYYSSIAPHQDLLEQLTLGVGPLLTA